MSTNFIQPFSFLFMEVPGPLEIQYELSCYEALWIHFPAKNRSIITAIAQEIQEMGINALKSSDHQKAITWYLEIVLLVLIINLFSFRISGILNPSLQSASYSLISQVFFQSGNFTVGLEYAQLVTSLNPNWCYVRLWIDLSHNIRSGLAKTGRNLFITGSENF